MATTSALERVTRRACEIVDRAGITQTSLARHLHMTQQTVSRKLKGEIPFRLEELDDLADFLGVTPEELTTRDTAGK